MGEDIEVTGNNGDRVRVNVLALLAQLAKHFEANGQSMVAVPMGNGYEATLALNNVQAVEPEADATLTTNLREEDT